MNSWTTYCPSYILHIELEFGKKVSLWDISSKILFVPPQWKRVFISLISILLLCSHQVSVIKHNQTECSMNLRSVVHAHARSVHPNWESGRKERRVKSRKVLTSYQSSYSIWLSSHVQCAPGILGETIYGHHMLFIFPK